MNLSGLHLLLSYRCVFECDHCFVFSSPRAETAMTLAFIKDAIDQASEIPEMKEIFFEGGEPTLYYPLFVAGARYAREKGLNVGVVSNAWYATTVEDATEWLRPFSEMGNVFFSFSDDTFHMDQDSETPAQRAQKAGRNLGIEVDEIRIEEPCVAEDVRRHGEPIVDGGVRFRGRAAEKLIDDSLPKQPWDSFTECPDEDFDSVGRLHLDPDGWLYSCQGVVIGNLKEQSLTDIAVSWDPDSNPIVGPLKRGGPAELVRTFDLPLHDHYHDACHLCYLARKQLRERFPQHLAPGRVYGEDER